MLATIILIIGLLTLAILFVIYVISNANGSGYELYVFRHGGCDEYYEIIMFNNKNKKWQVNLCKEHYIKVSSVFNITELPETYEFTKFEYYAFLNCNKTIATKIKFYIDSII